MKCKIFKKDIWAWWSGVHNFLAIQWNILQTVCIVSSQSLPPCILFPVVHSNSFFFIPYTWAWCVWKWHQLSLLLAVDFNCDKWPKLKHMSSENKATRVRQHSLCHITNSQGLPAVRFCTTVLTKSRSFTFLYDWPSLPSDYIKVSNGEWRRLQYVFLWPFFS